MGTQIVQVSPTRDRIGRVILAALAGAAVVAGVVGAVGVHSLGPRLVAMPLDSVPSAMGSASFGSHDGARSQLPRVHPSARESAA